MRKNDIFRFIHREIRSCAENMVDNKKIPEEIVRTIIYFIEISRRGK